MVTHQLQVERRTRKVRQSETDVLPLCYVTNLVFSYLTKIPREPMSCPLSGPHLLRLVLPYMSFAMSSKEATSPLVAIINNGSTELIHSAVEHGLSWIIVLVAHICAEPRSLSTLTTEFPAAAERGMSTVGNCYR